MQTQSTSSYTPGAEAYSGLRNAWRRAIVKEIITYSLTLMLHRIFFTDPSYVLEETVYKRRLNERVDFLKHSSFLYRFNNNNND